METINLYIPSFLGKKCQAHYMKAVGSNPTHATNYLTNLIITE